MTCIKMCDYEASTSPLLSFLMHFGSEIPFSLSEIRWKGKYRSTDNSINRKGKGKNSPKKWRDLQMKVNTYSTPCLCVLSSRDLFILLVSFPFPIYWIISLSGLRKIFKGLKHLYHSYFVFSLCICGKRVSLWLFFL